MSSSTYRGSTYYAATYYGATYYGRLQRVELQQVRGRHHRDDLLVVLARLQPPVQARVRVGMWRCMLWMWMWMLCMLCLVAHCDFTHYARASRCKCSTSPTLSTRSCPL